MINGRPLRGSSWKENQNVNSINKAQEETYPHTTVGSQFIHKHGIPILENWRQNPPHWSWMYRVASCMEMYGYKLKLFAKTIAYKLGPWSWGARLDYAILSDGAYYLTIILHMCVQFRSDLSRNHDEVRAQVHKPYCFYSMIIKQL